MSDPRHRWVDEVKQSVDALKTVRDELKVQMHLASMDAKTRFTELEQRVDKEQLGLRRVLDELLTGFRALKEELAQAAKDDGPGKHA